MKAKLKFKSVKNDILGDESGIRAGRELYWTGARTTFDVMVAASKLK